MKKIFAMIFVAAAVFAGCNKHVIEEPGNLGSLSLKLSYEGEYATKAVVPQVNIDEFKVKLERPADQWEKVFTYAELNEQVEENGAFPLLPGNYNITAYSPDTKPAEWEQPIFSGSSSFSVKVGEVTSVSISCTLQNMMVTIQVSDAFANELVDFDVTVTNGLGTLVWSKAEVESGKAGFFTVAPLRIHVNGYRTATSDPAIYDGQITNVAAKDHHIIKLDAVNTGAVGGIDITVDYSTNDIFSNFEVPGVEWNPVPGDPETPDPDEGGTTPPAGPVEPEIDGLSLTWPNNTNYATYELKSEYADGEVDLTVYSRYGIKSFLVKITSPHEGFMTAVVSQMGAYMDGEYAVLDLMDPEIAEKMAGLELAAGDELKGEDKTIPFKLKGLLPFITYFEGLEKGSIHTFVMDVTDEKDQNLVKTLTFEYKGN